MGNKEAGKKKKKKMERLEDSILNPQDCKTELLQMRGEIWLLNRIIQVISFNLFLSAKREKNN